MNLEPTRRACLQLGASLAVASWPSHAATQSEAAYYPSKPIRLVIPFPPGGTTDVLARDIAALLSGRLGQPIIVDNRAGAGGLIGNEAVARAPADGYTVLLTTSQVALAPALYPKLPYDVLTDLMPLGRVVESRSLLLSSDSRMPSVQAFVQRAKASPGTIGYGTPGTGTAQHIFAALLSREAGIDVVHVPYKGSGPMLTDLLAGHVPVALTDVAAPLPYVQAGRLKALAINGKSRMQQLPDTPTLAELGFKNFDVVGWYGLFAPAKTPAAIVSKLQGAIAAMMQDSDLKAKIERAGLVPLPAMGEDILERVRSEMAYWKQAVSSHGIKVAE